MSDDDVSTDELLKITEQAEADAFFEKAVARAMRLAPTPVDDDDPMTRADAEVFVRRQIGYFAGYYSDEVRARLERLFRCAHPFFGAIAEKGPPSPEEAFRMGEALGESLRKGGR